MAAMSLTGLGLLLRDMDLAEDLEACIELVLRKQPSGLSLKLTHVQGGLRLRIQGMEGLSPREIVRVDRSGTIGGT
jgi:hypothetical protein